MPFKSIACFILLALTGVAAPPPVPELRTLATDGGSVFLVRNVSSLPLRAYLIELVNYPGSFYMLWQDEDASPLPPGGEKKIAITNMTVGAVPEYVKLQAALYADGTTSGNPDRVAQLLERRKHMLATTHELIVRLEKAQAAGAAKAATAADLKQWAESIPAPTRANRGTQTGINQAAARGLIINAAARIEARTIEEALNGLRASERLLAAGK